MLRKMYKIIWGFFVHLKKFIPLIYIFIGHVKSALEKEEYVTI